MKMKLSLHKIVKRNPFAKRIEIINKGKWPDFKKIKLNLIKLIFLPRLVCKSKGHKHDYPFHLIVIKC